MLTPGVRLPRRLGSCGAAALLLTFGCAEESTAPSAPEPGSLSTVEAVTFAANSWTPRPGIPEYRSNYSVGTFPDAAGVWLVYVIGGLGETGSFQQFSHTYNVETNSWARRQPVTNVHSLNGVSKIGVKLRKLRKSQVAIAKATGQSEVLVSHVLSGRRLHHDGADKIIAYLARLLSIPPDICFPELNNRRSEPRD
jgi:hypothetical protein